MALILLLTAVCAITFTFEIVFGLAGTILMLMVMSFFYDTKTLVIYSILPQLLVGTIGLHRSPKTVNIRYLGTMLLFGAAGGFAGVYLFNRFSGEVFHTLLASAITLFGVLLIASPGKIRFPRLVQRLLDTVAGVSQALFGISGPIMMTRLLGTYDDKLVIRNCALAFFLAMNLFRLVAYLVNDTITSEVLEMMMISAPVLALVLWNSNHLHMKVNEQLFRKVVSWMILLGGISLLLQNGV